MPLMDTRAPPVVWALYVLLTCNRLFVFFYFPSFNRLSLRVGGLSAINGIAGAYSDDLPVILISGGPNYKDTHDRHIIHHTIGEYEFYQQYRCFTPVVADIFVIKHPNDAARMIDEAISTAFKKKKPVYLEIPCNLALHPVTSPVPITSVKEMPRKLSDSQSLETALEDIVRAIDASTKPVLLAGSKLRMAEATDQFKQVAERLDCAVAIMPDAKGLFPENHPNFIGRYWGSVSSHHVAEVVESSDLVIMAGPVLNDYTTVGWSALLNEKKTIILGPNYVKFGEYFYPDIQLPEVLECLSERVSAKGNSLATYRRYTEGRQDEEYKHSASDSLHLKGLKNILEKSFTSETTLLVETGDSWFIGQSFKLPEGAKYHVQMQYGSIGWSVGALLGVALAEGQSRRVIALIGDGSFQMTAQEVSTMIRQNVKATIILLNNNGYTIEVEIHDGPYNDIKKWDYAGLINVFNCEEGNGLAMKAKTCQEFEDALKKSEEHDGLTLIECFLERDDCTAELLEWGSRVAAANGRK
jgi:pyruvate decarboxylase